MNETALFIAGTAVSGIVGTGVFLYAMLSFGRWADRTESESNG
ncbi:MAG: hypothetical protein P8J30_02435 [Ilumatobacter sp.]|nr:hypothetical protein [Ilumatobacter sp.]